MSTPLSVGTTQHDAMGAQEVRDLAAKYAEGGIPAFPIGLSWNHEKESIDKVPRTKNGFKDATTDLEAVEGLFLKSNLGPRQEWGVGVCPGPGGYLVFDVDIKNGATGLEDLAQLEEELGKLPPAMTVKTASGGFHLWFQRPHEGHIGNRNLAPGVEVRCDAGYVVAPGVSSPWGSWQRDPDSPRLSETPPLPQAWAESLDQRREDGSREPIAEKLTVGSRHAGLLRVGGAMRRQGSNYDEILAALTTTNEPRCDPPKPQSEIDALAADIADRYDPNPVSEVILPSGETLEEDVSKELTRLRTRDKARRIFNAENRPEVEQAEILTLRQLLARPQPDTEWRIDDWQPAGSRVMLAAQYKAGKTTLTGNLARSLVDGDPWLGVHPVAPVGRVGILDFEMSERQITAWLKDQAIEHDDRVTVIPMRGKASTFDLLDERTLDEWAERLANINYLILDCLRPILDALGLKESSEAGRFLTPFDELCDKAGIPDARIVHHLGHHDERSRGDSRLRDWPDVEWQLVRENKDDPASARYIKAYGRDVEVAESLLLYDAESRHLTLTGCTRKDTKARAAIPDIINLVETADSSLSQRGILEALSETAHSRESLKRALRLLRADGTLNMVKGPRNAWLFTLTAPVRRSAPTEKRRGQLSAPVPIGTGALNTYSNSEDESHLSEVTQEPLPDAL